MIKDQNPHPYKTPPSIELDNIDTNCNNCIHMKRDIEKFKSFDYLHKGQLNSRRFNYGHCDIKGVEVSFIPSHCMPENNECFKNRRE